MFTDEKNYKISRKTPKKIYLKKFLLKKKKEDVSSQKKI
jgi:hypothetical protein